MFLLRRQTCRIFFFAFVFVVVVVVVVAVDVATLGNFLPMSRSLN